MNDDRTPIDLKILADLLGEGDREIFSAVFQEFRDVARDSFNEVAESARRADAAALAATAHGAKGEARTAGATRLGDFYSEVEAQAKAGDIKAATATLASAGAELERVEAFIENFAGGAP